MPLTRNRHPALDYIQSLYAPEDDLLIEICSELTQRSIAWQIGAPEGRMLQLLMKLHGVKRIVEIGTLGGYSTLWMARGLPEDGHITTLESAPEHAALARGYFARSDVANRITLVEGDAHATLATLKAGPFDMVFIDAEKPGYNAYLDWAEAGGVRKGGLIIADNTFLFGGAWQDNPPDGVATTTWESMRDFNRRLADTSKYFGTILPTGDGMSVAIKLF